MIGKHYGRPARTQLTFGGDPINDMMSNRANRQDYSTAVGNCVWHYQDFGIGIADLRNSLLIDK